MKRILIVAAALLAAAFLLVFLLLPARPLTLPPAAWQPTGAMVRGAMHVHTQRSDGSGTPDEVARAAARAGLDFVILTDHGDGTREPDPPAYRSGVLCIDAVEISTSEGHYVALGLSRTPYPLGGEPRDVVEDVARLGGFGIAAHPDSAKPALQWHEWTAPLDGLEWMNADSEWRDEHRPRLARALITYPFRPVETLGSLLSRPNLTLLRWDTLTERRRVVGFAGADAHARLGSQGSDAEGYTGRWFAPLPSYETSFRTFGLRVDLSHRLSGDPKSDASALLEALRAGHVYTAIDAIASPAMLDFSARRGELVAEQGDRVEPDLPITFRARVNASTGGTIVMRKDGAVLTQHPVPELIFDAPRGAGVYRVEVYLAAPSRPTIPWIVSNPIYVEPSDWGLVQKPELPPVQNAWDVSGGPWHVEHDSRSTATSTPVNGRVEFTYRLQPGPRAGQYAALVMSAGNALTGHDRFTFTAHATRPMRISVQARQPSGERWQRSIYVDQQPRPYAVPFAQMTAVEGRGAAHFAPARIDTVLFVVDTTNTAPGSEGRFEIAELKVAH